MCVCVCGTFETFHLITVCSRENVCVCVCVCVCKYKYLVYERTFETFHLILRYYFLKKPRSTEINLPHKLHINITLFKRLIQLS